MYITLGTATRSCDSSGQWGQPNVLDCTSVEFIRLEGLVSDKKCFVYVRSSGTQTCTHIG